MQSSNRPADAAPLPEGCRIRALTSHLDARGDFTELFRNAWFDTPAPLQWNMSRSQANVMRGVHVHARHWDYVTVLAGHMTLGLHDLRPESATRFRSAIVELDAADPAVISIPPGMAMASTSRRPR
jgi:dTDP-4-dehydrorhamnose 3,5-epimerase